MLLSTYLDSHLKKDDHEIILVNANPYHQLIQETHLVAAGIRTAEQVRIPIAELIEGTNIKFIQSFIKKIKADKSKVCFWKLQKLFFTYLCEKYAPMPLQRINQSMGTYFTQ